MILAISITSCIEAKYRKIRLQMTAEAPILSATASKMGGSSGQDVENT